MTKYISKIKINFIRQFIWLAYFPLLYLVLWFKFSNNQNFFDLVWATWDTGWDGHVEL